MPVHPSVHLSVLLCPHCAAWAGQGRGVAGTLAPASSPRAGPLASCEEPAMVPGPLTAPGLRRPHLYGSVFRAGGHPARPLGCQGRLSAWCPSSAGAEGGRAAPALGPHLWLRGLAVSGPQSPAPGTEPPAACPPCLLSPGPPRAHLRGISLGFLSSPRPFCSFVCLFSFSLLPLLSLAPFFFFSFSFCLLFCAPRQPRE